MEELKIKQRMKELTQELKQYNYEYYILDNPTVDDIEYDSKMRELERLEKEYPMYQDPNTPTKQVGAFLKTELSHIPASICCTILCKSDKLFPVVTNTLEERNS